MELKVVAFVGPSGSGKTTIANRLQLPPLVSVTTRPRREGEVEGIDYYYISVEKFKELHGKLALVEAVNNYGKFYGITKEEVDRVLNAKELHHVIVTEHGLHLLNEYIPEGAIKSIFIYTPRDQVERRLRARGMEEEDMRKRLSEYDVELKSAVYCDAMIPSFDGHLHYAISRARNCIVRFQAESLLTSLCD